MKKKIIDADNDVASIAWVYKRASRRGGLAELKKRWRSVSRRKPFPARVGKFLLRRLAINKDPVALMWCVRHLGVLDWMSRELGPYLSLFANRSDLQRGILTHFRSPMNDSAVEESSLFRVLLSARTVRRDLLDYAREVVDNRNRSVASRQWASLLLGRHGDAADHRLVAAHALEDEHLARACVVAAQGFDAALRGAVFADVERAFEHQRRLIARLRGLRSPAWPVYQP